MKRERLDGEYGNVRSRNGSWLGVVSLVLLLISFYFTLTFFEQLKSGDDRLRKQAKIAALISLSAALLLPAVYQIYFINERMR